MTACTDLDEKVNDRIDANVYYQNEASVVGAVAAIYGQTSTTLGGQYFFHLSEYPADQLTWRVWNGGLWGWDEAEKTVLSWHQSLRLSRMHGAMRGRVSDWQTSC